MSHLIRVSDWAYEQLKGMDGKNTELVDSLLNSYLSENDTESKAYKYSNRKLLKQKNHDNTIEKWKENNYKGIFLQLPGSGKIDLAIKAMEKIYHDKGKLKAIVIVHSNKYLDFWDQRIKNNIFIPNLFIDTCNEKFRNWKEEDSLKLFTDPKFVESSIFITTIKTAKSNEFIEKINQGKHITIIIDEVHRKEINNSNILNINSGYRLGLSSVFIEEENKKTNNYFHKTVYKVVNNGPYKNKVQLVDIDLVEPNDYNPNKVTPKQMLQLSSSIEQNGLLHPILTIYDDKRKKYIIVDGFHRYHALKNNPSIRKRTNNKIPIVVHEKDIISQKFELLDSTKQPSRQRSLTFKDFPGYEQNFKAEKTKPPSDIIIFSTLLAWNNGILANYIFDNNDLLNKFSKSNNFFELINLKNDQNITKYDLIRKSYKILDLFGWVNYYPEFFKGNSHKKISWKGDFYKEYSSCLSKLRRIKLIEIVQNEVFMETKDLHTASRENSPEEVVKILVNGADVNETDERGWTALHYAALEDSTEVAKILVENGADVNKPDEYNITDLMEKIIKSLTEDGPLTLPEIVAKLQSRSMYKLSYKIEQEAVRYMINSLDNRSKANYKKRTGKNKNLYKLTKPSSFAVVELAALGEEYSNKIKIQILLNLIESIHKMNVVKPKPGYPENSTELMFINKGEQWVSDILNNLRKVRPSKYLGALQNRPSKLSTALRKSHVRGRWGEIELRRVVEIAGMTNYCDFSEQVSIIDEETNIRPDLTVNLAGGKKIVVDAKTPMEAYLNVSEFEDVDYKNSQLNEHLRQTKDHITSLSSKSYYRQFPTSPELVIMFIPNDSMFMSILNHDPGLMGWAEQKNVFLASRITLIAVLKAVAVGSREESFLTFAKENLNKFQSEAKSDLDKEKISTEEFLVKPLRETLNEVDKKIKKERDKISLSSFQQVESLVNETYIEKLIRNAEIFRKYSRRPSRSRLSMSWGEIENLRTDEIMKKFSNIEEIYKRNMSEYNDKRDKLSTKYIQLFPLEGWGLDQQVT